MGFLSFVFALFVEPLKLLFEVLFFYAYKTTRSAGISIVIMSLAVNLLLLPLYSRADKIEKEQRLKKDKMSAWIKRIKSAFKGDERIMILQAWYKENDYRTTDLFKESVSLFLQIPFFIAAYNFLSNLELLHGIPLGPISDLGTPDNLISAGALSINLLPILMTVINIISGLIYSSKGDIKGKARLILIALVFLILLYNSPAGLVFYWTLNNLFSLIKNIVVRIKDSTDNPSVATRKSSKINKQVLILSCAILAVTTGAWIPSDVIAANPQELINMFSATPQDPTVYLLSSTLTALGLFLIWIPLLCYLMRDTLGSFLTYALSVLAVNAIVNYFLFNKNFGLLSNKLVYENPMLFSSKDIFINIAVNILAAAIVVIICLKFQKYLKFLLGIILFAVILLSAGNLNLIRISMSRELFIRTTSAEDVHVPMSTTGQNVVVIMADRFMSAYLPFIFNERPDVAEQFDGFTYYPNTVSFGEFTNTGSPAVFGGYEYTPAAINMRSDELLVDKHNEALMMMPVLFAENGWNVSVGDPVYANYQWIPDPSIFDGYDDINAFQMAGVFNDRSELFLTAGEDYDNRLNRNFFCYGLMKTMPYLIQPLAYSSGSFNCMDYYYFESEDVGFVEHSMMAHTQKGIYEAYFAEYLALDALSDIVDVTDENENSFFIFSNGTAHNFNILSEPEYMPAVTVDNTEYDRLHEDRFTLDGVTLHMDPIGPAATYANYECCMATCIALGRWFDYLRANDLYDNTRIIIVADHGNIQQEFDDLMIDGWEFSAQAVNPILLVKDFGGIGFTVSNEFMTNADTPYLAVEGLIDNPVNPFTGMPITQNDQSEEQFIYVSNNWDVINNNGTQFVDPDGYWVSVRDNIFDDSNWLLLANPPYEQ